MTRLPPIRSTAAALAVLTLAACSSQPPSSNAPRRASSTPATGSRVDQAPNAAPGPTSAGGFDAVHAAQVLGPSVSLIIVSSRSETAEGSGFVISARGGTSYIATNNHVVSGSRTVE